MAKDKGSSNRPQAQHKTSQASQHDKRERLQTPNPKRRKTEQAKIPLVGKILTAVISLQAVLDRRSAFRFGIIVAGMFLADGRRTASAWFAAAGVKDDWDRFYNCLINVGKRSGSMAAVVVGLVVKKFGTGRFLLAIDDSPTSRYGRHVEGAGVHHNPTPGPADGQWLFGHNWVCLAFVAKHPLWGVIALPLRSLLYVRAVDVPRLQEKNDWEFRTKHQLAVTLVLWFVKIIRGLGLKNDVWVVADGAYAAIPFIEPLRQQGVVIVSRLRKDACLFDLPPTRKAGQRGRPRIYGQNKLSLARRAAHNEGWSSITYPCRGEEVTRQYKTFLATSRLTGDVIRVVIVRFDNGGWAAYFSTDPSVEAKDILEAVADRWAIEECFHDAKEVWGAGQQQVRNVWSSIGCWNLNHWMFTLVELCCWDQKKTKLTNRSDRPWDNADRRPSHADRKRSIRKEMLEKQFLTGLPTSPDRRKFARLVKDLIRLAA